MAVELELTPYYQLPLDPQDRPVLQTEQEVQAGITFSKRIVALREVFCTDDTYATRISLIRWFKSGFAPDGATEIYSTFLAKLNRQYHHEGYPYWWEEKIKEVQLGKMDDLEQAILDQVVNLGLASNTKQAAIKLDKTLKIFEGIVQNEEDYRYWQATNADESEYPGTVVIFNPDLPWSFRKKLAMCGIIFATQFNLLTPQESAAIVGITLPPEFPEKPWQMDDLDTLLSVIYEKYPVPKIPDIAPKYKHWTYL